MKKTLLLCASLFSFYSQAQEYAPLQVTSGFNADVIANGVGNASASTTLAVDNANFRIEFNDFFKNKKSNKMYYWMDLGNGKDNAQCVLGSREIKQIKVKDSLSILPTIIDRFPNLVEHDTFEQQGENCSSYSEKLNEQNLFINDTLSSFASNLLWEVLTVGYITKFGFFLNNKDLKCNPIII